jgi:hypothetical protein
MPFFDLETGPFGPCFQCTFPHFSALLENDSFYPLVPDNPYLHIRYNRYNRYNRRDRYRAGVVFGGLGVRRWHPKKLKRESEAHHADCQRFVGG